MPDASLRCGSPLIHARPSRGQGCLLRGSCRGAWCFGCGRHMMQEWLTCDSGIHHTLSVPGRRVSCMGYMLFLGGTHVTHSLLTNVFRLLRRGWHVAHPWPSHVSGVAPLWFMCGSNLEHVCFTHVSHVVQVCLTWFSHGSAVAPKWFRCNSGVAHPRLMCMLHTVEECLSCDSGVAHTWCKCGSDMAHMEFRRASEQGQVWLTRDSGVCHTWLTHVSGEAHTWLRRGSGMVGMWPRHV